MNRGKSTCKVLKEVRREIARANDIPLEERKCTYTGDCAGTCPYCEAEVRYLEREIAKRRSLGKVVSVVGIALSAVTVVGCATTETVSTVANQPQKTSGKPITDALVSAGGITNLDPPSFEKKKEQSAQCTTFQVSGIVHEKDSAKHDSETPVKLDPVVVEYTPPEFQLWQGTVSQRIMIVKDVWRFPSNYGTLRSYLHRQMKKNPELKRWIRKKRWQERHDIYNVESKRVNTFSLWFNPYGEVVEINLMLPIKNEEDERMIEELFRIAQNMPLWKLNPKKNCPDDLVIQKYPYRFLR